MATKKKNAKKKPTKKPKPKKPKVEGLTKGNTTRLFGWVETHDETVQRIEKYKAEVQQLKGAKAELIQELLAAPRKAADEHKDTIDVDPLLKKQAHLDKISAQLEDANTTLTSAKEEKKAAIAELVGYIRTIRDGGDLFEYTEKIKQERKAAETSKPAAGSDPTGADPDDDDIPL
jgi:uncharacterized coiled-coil DUF342 family protein